MIVRINHPDISGNEKTYLSVAASATNTTLTVQNIEGFSTSEYLVLGKLGEEKTELVQINTTTAPSGTTITLTGAISFDHSVNTPVTFIGFNQVAIYSSSTKSGTYTIVGSATDIEVDQQFTEINDANGSTSTWYKSRYYNATSTLYSSYSDSVQGSGYTEDSLKKIIEKANSLSNDRGDNVLTETEKIDLVNDGYQKVINRLERADHKRFLKKGYVDIKNSYDTGTIAVTDGGITVTGTDTVWVGGWAGQKIIFGEEAFPYEIDTVDSSTGITLIRAYDGEDDLSGETYEVFRDEYDLYNEATGAEVVDFKKIEQVIDKDGSEVSEFDLNRRENGYYLKRQGEDLKFCLNYRPSTTDSEGRWTVWYRYQPVKLDSMADEPEFPNGYSSILVSYLTSKIWERKGDLNKAAYYIGEYTEGHNRLIRESVPRTKQRKGFRIDRNLRSGTEHEGDWIADIYSRKTIDNT